MAATTPEAISATMSAYLKGYKQIHARILQRMGEGIIIKFFGIPQICRKIASPRA